MADDPGDPARRDGADREGPAGTTVAVVTPLFHRLVPDKRLTRRMPAGLDPFRLSFARQART